MNQVYISSTYKDLKPYRRKVAKAIERLDCHPIAMESYVASDRRPVDKCLGDVKKSDAYVCIVARRYGYVPSLKLGGDGETSITHLEYNEAIKHNIPCFAFVLNEQATWKSRLCDSDLRRVTEFQQILKDNHTVDAFTSEDSLDARVTAALTKHFFQLRGVATMIPPLLPYMSDRSRQRDQLADALDSHRHLRRPTIVVVHGDVREAHREFLNRVQRVTLPRLLELDSETEPVRQYIVDWTRPGGSVEERARHNRSSMAKELTGSRHAKVREIAELVSAARAPVMISCLLYASDWQPNEHQVVLSWFQMWGEWPTLTPDQQLFAFLCVQYISPDWKFVWQGRRPKKKNRQALEFIRSLDEDSVEGAKLTTLDRLESIRESDVRRWIQRDAAEFCRENPKTIDPDLMAEKLNALIRKLFSEIDGGSEGQGIPMECLAPKLRRRLRECLEQGGL